MADTGRGLVTVFLVSVVAFAVGLLCCVDVGSFYCLDDGAESQAPTSWDPVLVCRARGILGLEDRATKCAAMPLESGGRGKRVLNLLHGTARGIATIQ